MAVELPASAASTIAALATVLERAKAITFGESDGYVKELMFVLREKWCDLEDRLRNKRIDSMDKLADSLLNLSAAAFCGAVCLVDRHQYVSIFAEPEEALVTPARAASISLTSSAAKKQVGRRRARGPKVVK